MSNDKLDKIRDKIEKLLRLQESAEKIGSLEEAALAAANANKLMVKYNLEVSMDQALDQEEKVLWELLSMNELHNWNKTEAGWMRQLYHIISKHNFCKVVWVPRKEYIMKDGHYTGRVKTFEELKIFGEKTTVEMVKFIAAQLVERLKASHKISWKTYYGIEKKNTYRRGYLAGGVQGIATKLKEQEKINLEEYSGLVELVIIKSTKVDNFVSKTMGILRRSKNSSLSGQEGRNKGFADGRKITIREGVMGGQKRLN